MRAGNMLFLTLCFFSIQVSLGAKILVVVPMPSRSHTELLEPLAVELGRRGHQVTYISNRPVSAKETNVTNVVVDTAFTDSDGKSKNFLELRQLSMWDQVFFLPLVLESAMHKFMADPNLKAFLESKANFDLIIGEAFKSEGIMSGLVHKYKAPLIGFATFIPNYWVNYQVGNIAPTSYIPDPLSGITYQMNFQERLLTFLSSVLGEFNHLHYYFPMQEQFQKQYFGEGLPSAIETIKNTSLLLVNDHFSASFPRPSPPNMIGIAGVHIKPPKPLPKDIQEYLDNSKQGAILFSLGSIIQGSLMSKEKIQTFLNAFAKLKVNVVWKFEKSIENLPKNILISKWLPQADILAHPNIKLFITHCGLLSTTEAIYHGKPVIGIPIFGDQHTNARTSERRGMGLTLIYDEITEDILIKTINEVLYNPKYSEVAKTRSLHYHDVHQTPLERAMYWIEYVIRHKGAHHLRSSAQDLQWYQLYQLDVIAVLLASLYIAIKIILAILKTFIRIIFKRNNKIKPD